jgi:hypothetical protein
LNKKLLIYKVSTENRHLLKFLKKRKFIKRKRKKFRRVIRLERVTLKSGRIFTKKNFPKYLPRIKKFKKRWKNYKKSKLR